MARGTWGGALDPNIFKVTIRFRLGTQKCQTGFKLRDVGIDDNSEQDVADEVYAQLQAEFRGLLHQSDDALESIDAQIMGRDTGYSLPATLTDGTLGFGNDVGEPTFMATVVALKSEIRKRYGQGRMFLPTVSEASVDSDVLSAAGQAIYNTFITKVTDHFTGDEVTHDLLLVNAHPLLPAHTNPNTGRTRPEIPASWYDVLSLRLNTVVTSLRSRKVGVGS